jgi:hypothetical protein
MGSFKKKVHIDKIELIILNFKPLGDCLRIETVARESHFESDFSRIIGYLTKINGKSGQNGFRTSAWMHVGRTMQEQLSSRFFYSRTAS